MVPCYCLHHCISSKKNNSYAPQDFYIFWFLKGIKFRYVKNKFIISYTVWYLCLTDKSYINCLPLRHILEVFRENYLAESDAQKTKMVSSNRMLRGISTGAY